MKPRTAYAAKARWIIAVTLFTGIILILTGELTQVKTYSGLLSNVLTQLGTALAIASVLGLFLELTEIKEFFEKRLVDILSRDEFIDLMSIDRLIELTVTTVSGIGRRRTTNPLYDYHDFAYSVGYDILENVGKIYREDFFETIEYTVLRDDEIRQLGIHPSGLNSQLSRIVCTSRYQVILPAANQKSEYTITNYYYTASIPGVEPNKHFTFELTVNGEPIDVDLSKFIKVENQETSFNFEHKIELSEDTWIEMKLTSLEYELSGSFTNSMEELTKNVTLHFSSREELQLDAEIFGMTKNYTPPSITSNSVSIQHPGWVLPGQGYFITWKQKQRNEGRNAQQAAEPDSGEDPASG